jgi:bacterioferritin
VPSDSPPAERRFTKPIDRQVKLSSPGFFMRLPTLWNVSVVPVVVDTDTHSLPQEQAMAKTKPFVSDIENIRKRARQDIDKGAMTAGYAADRSTVVKLLNQALATELVCVLRYKYHYYMASGINSQAVKAEFLEHANQEQGHADLIAERITQLDGKPNLSPEGMLSRSHADYVEGVDLVDMIKEDLVAERIAIDSYREIIDYIGADDSTTRRMLEGILAMEEEHAEDMNTLLEQLGKKGEPAKAAPGKKSPSGH